MKQNKKTVLATVYIILAVLIVTVSAVFAYFSYDENIATDISTISGLTVTMNSTTTSGSTTLS